VESITLLYRHQSNRPIDLSAMLSRTHTETESCVCLLSCRPVIDVRTMYAECRDAGCSRRHSDQSITLMRRARYGVSEYHSFCSPRDGFIIMCVWFIARQWRTQKANDAVILCLPQGLLSTSAEVRHPPSLLRLPFPFPSP